jgi:SHS family lactate transporter-like MFS transporter
MMLRPLGAAAFGAAADAFGRKWPFIVNCSLLIIFELLSGFSHTYEQFLAFRAIFGVAMGGLYGNAATTALEDCPPKGRGLLSGIFQSGYPFGYLLAVVFSIAFKNTAPGWRALFWFAACPPIIFIVLRLFMDETDIYKERMSLMRPLNTSLRSVFDNTVAAVQSSWPILIYLIILMTGFSLMVRNDFLVPRIPSNKQLISRIQHKTCTRSCSKSNTTSRSARPMAS